MCGWSKAFWTMTMPLASKASTHTVTPTSTHTTCLLVCIHPVMPASKLPHCAPTHYFHQAPHCASNKTCVLMQEASAFSLPTHSSTTLPLASFHTNTPFTFTHFKTILSQVLPLSPSVLLLSLLHEQGKLPPEQWLAGPVQHCFRIKPGSV